VDGLKDRSRDHDLQDPQGTSSVGGEETLRAHSSLVLTRGRKESDGRMGVAMSSANQSSVKVYILVGSALIVLGVAWVWLGPTTSVTYKPIEGIGVFAALYLIAQAAERVTEWVGDLLSLRDSSPQQKKERALQRLRAANSTLNGNPTLADFGAVAGAGAAVPGALTALVEQNQSAVEQKEAAEGEVKETRREITFLAHGVSVAVCAVGVNALNYGVLAHIGAQGFNPDVDRLLTVAAAAGGTKALHELIGRMQKAKESAETGESAT
jgi:hypothetical protein